MSNDCEERDWTGLPEELLHLIYKKLPDIRDFIRFRTVCKSWCCSAPLSDPPEQQLPWLLDAWYENVLEGSALGTKHMFYSPFYGEVGSIDIEPRCRGKVFHGACREYLLLGHDSKGYHEGESFALFNPLTNSYIRFAQMPENYNLWRNFESYCPVWTNDDPIIKGSIAIFFDTYPAIGMPVIYNLHTMEWAVVNYVHPFTTCCYMKGMFFATSLGSETYIFCEKSLQLLDKIPSIMEEQVATTFRNYLVACADVILRVCWLEDTKYHGTMETCEFLLYRLDYQVGGVGHNWVEIDNIGDQMLFLDEMNGFSVRARPTDAFKGNCIYFLYPWPSGRPYRYDISTGTIEAIPCPFRECGWFIPGMR